MWGRGTAFVLDWKARAYLVSCYHVFGSSLGDASFKRSGRTVGLAAHPLPLKGRMADFGARSSPYDLAVIPIARLDAASRHFKLAAQPPLVGQPVWLFCLPWNHPRDEADLAFNALNGNPDAGSEETQTSYVAAIVTRSSNKALEFVYDAAPDITMTSGAPILDQNGDVVGINVGMTMEGGRGVGLATPYSALADALERYGSD